MFSDMDLPDEILSLPFDDLGNVDSEDLSLDLGLQSMLDDPSIDLCSFSFLDDVPPKPIGDTSDSDSGISNHGDKFHPFDVEQGSADISKSNAFQGSPFSPSSVINTIVDDDATIFRALSRKLKRPMPSEPLITASHNSSAIHLPATTSISASRTFALSCGAALATIRQNPTTNCVPVKIPRILSRGQHVNRAMTSSTQENMVNSGEQLDQRGALVPAIVSLPVIDEFTFSNSFQVISSPTESDSFEKLVKKQERMIKNRQAACLSRLRKKEYLERLEYKLDQLRQENAHLRQENNEWRHRYDHLEKCLDNLQTEFASVCRPLETDVEPSPCSPPILSTFTKHNSSPPPPPQQPQSSVINKIPFLKRQNAERIVTQRAGTSCGLLGSSRVLGGVGMLQGVRKKVTTSLFAVACLFFLNIFLTPFGQFGGSLTTFGKNVGVVPRGYENAFVKPQVGGRTLLSIPSMQGVLETIKSSTNQTDSAARVGSGIHSKANTTPNETSIECCLPGSFLDSGGEVLWIVYNEDNEGLRRPLSKRQKQPLSNHQNQVTPELLLNWNPNKADQLGRFQRRRPREVYLVQTSQEEKWSGDLNDEDLTDSLYLLAQSTSSNLTIFLQNEQPPPHLPPGDANATGGGLRFCKLQVRIACLRGLLHRQ